LDTTIRIICGAGIVAWVGCGAAAGAPAFAQAIAAPAQPAAQAASVPVTVTVDAAASRHPISPYIYGVCFGNADELKALNFTINRYGGNASSRYNWTNNSYNNGNDWYFESSPAKDQTPGKDIDDIVGGSRAAGAQPMVSIPMIGWVAKVVDPNTLLYSFSVKTYGAQQKTDPYHPDAGNGVLADGTHILNADPKVANVPSDVAFQRRFIEHEVAKWGNSDHGGVRYYIMDNEPGIWQETHQDVHPKGPTSREIADDIIAYGTMVKSVDPHALIVGPEEWGWAGWKISGADKVSGWLNGADRASNGGLDNVPAVLKMIHAHDLQTGKRTIDVVTCHLYPQGGGGDTPEQAELLRNRNTRQIWDPTYVDESWINQPVMMIPMMRDAVAKYYPGTKIGITEYDWGAQDSMSGATAEADVLGIFGREGLDIATHWTTPKTGSPLFRAMQMYRNYDGNKSTFGETSVQDMVPSPDDLSSFAAIRKRDGALTVMVVNKDLTGTTPLTLSVAHFRGGSAAQVWELASGSIKKLDNVPISASQVQATLPAQSVTLFVIPRR
jgi:hypothetical protein